MSIPKNVAVVAAITAITGAVSAAPQPARTETTEKAQTVAALKDFNANQAIALASLAEKLKASDLGKDDARLLDELLTTGEVTLKDMSELTDAQRAYLKPVQANNE